MDKESKKGLSIPIPPTREYYAENQKTHDQHDADLPRQNLRDSDLRILLTYNRATGHLLRYDRLTGQLDLNSQKILARKGVLKRLLDAGMIYPGGKLTAAGIKRCAELSGNFRDLKLGEADADGPGNVQDKIIDIPKDKLQMFQPPAKPVLADRADKPSRKAVEDIIFKEDRPHLPADNDPQMPDRMDNDSTGYDQCAIDKNLISWLSPHSFEAEQFKILRSRLLFPSAGQPPRSILVTSALPNEGKSFVASNLALSIAQDVDKHVLLLDCDLRRPSIHKQFGFADVPGLSDYLVGSKSLPSLFLKTGAKKLTILPAGRSPDNPAELLSSSRMASLLQEIVLRYSDRLIVIDSPPPNITSETSALSRQVDAILLVIKFGKTPRKLLKTLIASLGKEKIIGTIFNRFEMASWGHDGYRKYREYRMYCNRQNLK